MKHILVIAGIALIAALTVSEVRGLRNNNWLNIRHDKNNKWKGMVGVDDKGFVKYSHPIYSLRAGFRLLNSYKNKSIDTIEKIISRFAPSNENPTEQYIRNIAQLTGIPRNTTVTAFEWPKLLQAMVKVEVGKNVSLNELYRAQSMAFS